MKVILLLMLLSQASLLAGEVHEALWDKGDPEKALTLLKSDKSLANAKDEKKCTPLHHAARWKHLEVVRWLVDAKVDLNAKAYNGFTPLHLTSDKATASLLIRNGADLNIRDTWGNTPLQSAAENTNQYAGLIEAILESGHPLDLKSALWLRKTSVAKALVLANPKLLQVEKGTKHLQANVTPLGIAALLGEKELVELFLKLGAPVNAMTERPEGGFSSPLQNAVMAQQPEIVEILCRAKADVNTVGGRFILSETSDVLHIGPYDFLLDYAMANSTPQIVDILKRHGARASTKSATPNK
jgi:ankyrin repeat protein